MDVGTREQRMFVILGDLTAEAHAVLHPVGPGVLAQLGFPPAGTDDIQNRPRNPSHGVHGMLNLLVRHEARQRHQVDLSLALQGRHVLRQRVDAIFNNVRITNAQLLQVALRGLRDRHPRVVAVERGDYAGFQEPPQPRQDRAGHRPLLAVAVVRQDHHGRTSSQAREEGDAVVGIHHDIKAAHTGRAEQHRQQRARVDAELGPSARVEHAVAALALRGVHVARSTEDHLVALGSEVLADALEVALRATALRVSGIAPTE